MAKASFNRMKHLSLLYYLHDLKGEKKGRGGVGGWRFWYKMNIDGNALNKKKVGSIILGSFCNDEHIRSFDARAGVEPFKSELIGASFSRGQSGPCRPPV